MDSRKVGAMSVRADRIENLRIGATALVVVVFAYIAFADEPEGAKKRHDSDELRNTGLLIQAELPHWKVGMGADAEELKLDPKPILRWTNPASGRMHGEIYVWTAGGRPETVMSLYKVWEPAWGFAGELQSLSLTNVVAKRDQAVVWKCDKPGITLHDFPDAPAIADTAQRRLAQMRALADGFSAVLIDYRQNAKGERQSLRLLTKPVYRYSSPSGGVTDGAMFAFVMGTDAEVLLLVEARETKGGSRWQYALARLNCDELVGYIKEREVWRVGRATYEERDKPYVFMGLSESDRP
jgi:hypothetical protein